MARHALRRGTIALAILAVYAVHLACYLTIDAINSHRVAHRLFLPGEARIPFVPAWGSVYALAYVFPLVAIFTLRKADRVVRLLVAIGLAMAVTYSCFLALPVEVPRPALDVHSVGSFLLSLQYRWDKPYNAFPSLHVAYCWLVTLASWDRTPWRVPLVALVAAISASTLFVKQHYAVDVLAGLGVAQAAWAAAGPLARRLSSSIAETA
jgi:membrane-associated phospholipid phosphatase